MKRIITLLLATTMLFSFAACSSEPAAPIDNTPSATNAPGTDAPADSLVDEAPAEEPAEITDNTLAEYYLQKANEVVVTDTHVTFTDDSGRGEISIEKNPKNAAILYGSLACLWYEAGGTAQMAIGGDSNTTLYNEQIGRDIAEDEGVNVVADTNLGSKWDVEAILAQNPDLIVCSMGMSGYETIGATAEAAGVPIIAIQYDHVQDYLKWFKVFCNLTGHPELWESVGNATAEEIVDIVSRVPADAEQESVMLLTVSSGKLRIYGTEAAPGTILKELGGYNVAEADSADDFTYREVDLEQVYAMNADMILITQMGDEGETKKQLEELVGGNPVWEDLNAVKNDRVYFLEKGLFHNKPNHRYQEAYLKMAQLLYPETFGEAVIEVPHYPVTITNVNFAKEPVDFTYEKAPERVITFWTNSLETMLALGLGDRVICAVGMSEEEVLPELQDEVTKMKENVAYENDFVNSNAAMSKESAIMMEPDFILGWKSSFNDKTVGDVTYWNENGIGTYIALNSNDVSENRTLENEYEDILNIGRIFDVEEKAEELVNEMKDEVARVTEAVADQEKRTVLVIEFMRDSIWNYDKTMLAGNMVLSMGGDLMDAPSDLGKEDLLNLDPDVIFVIGSSEEKLQKLTEDPGLASLTCVQNGDCYLVPLDYVYTSGVRTIYGLNALGAGLYPELYAE